MITTKDRTKCEIWTRVMGYHRPVSQYNFGKKSEFYSRNYFNAAQEENDKLISKYGSETQERNTSPVRQKNLLFTTTTCPKCPAVKNFLDKSETEYFSIDNTMLNFSEMAEKYNVKSVPTMMRLDEQGQEVWRANELSEIQLHLAQKC